MSTPSIPGNPKSFILFLLILNHLQLGISDSKEIKIEGACLNQCMQQHPDPINKKGYTLSYRFNCNEAYENEAARETCREACESCPKAVCDEYIDANKWHCPSPVWPQKCSDYCENHRPKGNRNSFTFECDTSDYDCSNYACGPENGRNRCPEYLCTNNGDKITIYCPPISLQSIASNCKILCDEARTYKNKKPSSLKESRVEPFKFKCDTLYATENDKLQKCKAAYWGCPEFVRDKDSIGYYCPAAEITDKCKKFCDERRKGGGKGSSAFIFDCKKKTGSNWKKECENLCRQNCDSYEFVCNPDNPENFFCPQEDPENEEPKGQFSYKGTCKNRCDMTRGGGYLEFDIPCEGTRYVTSEEKKKCVDDCGECPTNVCNNQTDKTFHCEKLQKEIDREKREKEQKIKEREQQLIDAQNDYEAKVAAVEEERMNKIYWCLGFMAFFAIIVALYIILAERNYRKQKKTSESIQEKPGALPLPQQNSALSLSSVPSGNLFPPPRT